METTFEKDISVEALKPYANNYLNHSKNVDHIKNSLKDFGYVKTSIVVDENYELLCGHGTLEAIKQLGWITVPEIKKISGMPEKHKRAYRIADNTSAHDAELIMPNLEIEIEALEDEFDLTDYGLDLKDIPAEEIVEDEAPPVPAIPKTVTGDIYELGQHRLVCGDSTLYGDVAKLMNERKCDMYLSDPPYNVAYVGKTKDALTIQNDKMEDDAFRQFLSDAFKNVDAFLKGGGVFYIWHADLEGYNFRGACRDAFWKVRQCLIWSKNSLVMGRQDYHWKHEPCLYGWKDGASHLWNADRTQTTILEFDRPTRSEDHPTMKPVALFAYQIQNNTKNEDIVLDNFLGSGTTLIACEQTKRICYGLELDPKYCDVIVQRWVNLTGGKVIRNGEEIEWPVNKE